MAKYYYIDKNGKKQEYNGKIITDLSANKQYGILISHNKIEQKIKLDYCEEVEANKGYSSYFGYIDENNNIVKYEGNIKDIKKDFKGSYFITKVQSNEIELKKYDEVKSKDAYFTYIGKDNKEHLYIGNKQPIFSKYLNSYYIYE